MPKKTGHNEEGYRIKHRYHRMKPGKIIVVDREF